MQQQLVQMRKAEHMTQSDVAHAAGLSQQAAMMQDPIYKETCIVINNSSTYRTIMRLGIKNKIIILNYPCNHDVDTEGENKIILCYGKEDVSIHPDVELSLLSKLSMISTFCFSMSATYVFGIANAVTNESSGELPVLY